jgi:hypothetical protein
LKEEQNKKGKAKLESLLADQKKDKEAFAKMEKALATRNQALENETTERSKAENERDALKLQLESERKQVHQINLPNRELGNEEEYEYDESYQALAQGGYIDILERSEAWQEVTFSLFYPNLLFAIFVLI